MACLRGPNVVATLRPDHAVLVSYYFTAWPWSWLVRQQFTDNSAQLYLLNARPWIGLAHELKNIVEILNVVGPLGILVFCCCWRFRPNPGPSPECLWQPRIVVAYK